MESNIIGFRLRKLRKKRKLSAREFSKAIGISQSAVSMYESGMRIPRDEIKSKIAKFYNVSVESIFLPDKFTTSEHISKNSGVMYEKQI